MNSILDISYGRFIYIYIYLCFQKVMCVYPRKKDRHHRFFLPLYVKRFAATYEPLRLSWRWDCEQSSQLVLVEGFSQNCLGKKEDIPPKKMAFRTHDGSVCMIYIYLYANKTGVFVDGKCGSIYGIHGSRGEYGWLCFFFNLVCLNPIFWIQYFWDFPPPKKMGRLYV